MRVGDNIWMKVRAKNEVGWSMYSDRQPQTIKVMGKPEQMPSPRVNINSRGASSRTFTACWQNLFFERTSQLSQDYAYDLRWGTAAGHANNLENKKTGTTRTCHKDRISKPQRSNLKFAVRATNACGPGPYSEVVVVNWSAPPCAPGKPCSHHADEHGHHSVLSKEIDLLDKEEAPLVPVPLPPTFVQVQVPQATVVHLPPRPPPVVVVPMPAVAFEPECSEPAQPRQQCTPCPPTVGFNRNPRCSVSC